MAQLSHNELQEIIDQDLPGYRVVERLTHAEDTPRPKADRSGPSISKLREKYLGARRTAGSRDDSENAESGDAPGASDEPGGTESDDDPENAEDSIVVVERAETSDPFDHRSRPKTVVVSGKDRRVIGSQG